jgi:phenylacetate-CoA ligase/benzoylacetate-CoA ligase
VLETMPWPDVERWQADRIVVWLGELPARSPFHADKLAGVAVPDRADGFSFLADLPFTTKDEIRRSQEDQHPGRPFGRHQGVPLETIVQTVFSSGTTGDPVVFALTGADLDVWRDGIATGFYTAGVRGHDVVAHLVGLPGVAGGLPYADGLRRIGATLAWLGGLPTEGIIRALPRLQVSALLATSSFGTYLADQDAAKLGVRRLLGGGEPGLGQPEIREKVRTGWQLDHVNELMGLGDVMSLLWAECDDEGGMHFCGQRSVAVELVDPATGAAVPWQDGVEGEAVYTTFARQATPALRYRSADHLVITATECPCGRTSPRVRCVGRTDDMLIYKAMNVFPSAIRAVVLDGFAGHVEPYLRIWKDQPNQVRYDTPIPVDIEAAPTLDTGDYDDVAGAIERDLRARLQIRTAVRLVAPGTLPRTAYKTPIVHVRSGGG